MIVLEECHGSRCRLVDWRRYGKRVLQYSKIFRYEHSGAGLTLDEGVLLLVSPDCLVPFLAGLGENRNRPIWSDSVDIFGEDLRFGLSCWRRR